MLINSQERLHILQAAVRDFRDARAAAPTANFYEDRLRAVWERARHSTRYGQLGPYHRQAFLKLSPTSKQELKDRTASLIVGPLHTKVKYYESSGTSGRVTPTPRDAQDIIYNAVSVAEAWRPLLPSDSRVAIALPSDIVPVGDLISSVCEYLDVAHIRCFPFTTGVSDWDRLFSMWRIFAPTVIFAAPGMLLQLTRVAKQRRLLQDLRDPVQTIMLLGEVNSRPFRTASGSWWQAKAFDASLAAPRPARSLPRAQTIDCTSCGGRTTLS